VLARPGLDSWAGRFERKTMPDDYYGDSGPAPEVAPEEAPEDTGTATALLPKEFFQKPDLEVGDECRIRVTQIADDQVVVEYQGHDGAEEPVEPRNSEVVPPEGMDQEMAGYMGV